MADPALAEPRLPSFSDVDDSPPLPPLDSTFFSDQFKPANYDISDLNLDDADFNFTFDDLFFSSDAEALLAGDVFLKNDEENHFSVNKSSVSYGVVNLENSADLVPDVDRILEPSSPNKGDIKKAVDSVSDDAVRSKCSENSGNHSVSSAHVSDSQSMELDSRDQRFIKCENSGNGCSSSGRVLNFPSPECGPASSHESGTEAANSLSPDSRGVSSKLVCYQKVQIEEIGKNLVSKRKIEQEDLHDDTRTSKFQRSSAPADNASCVGIGEEEKKKARLTRNRESAQLSRQRKKHYIEELEEKVKTMHSTIAELNTKISFFMAENASLRQQLGNNAAAGGVCPPQGMYPHAQMAPMAYPWMPCVSYLVKPQGSQVPLVPIPRLKPQQPISAAKAKKAECKKTEGKSRKVASVSFLGFVFFILLLGGIVPTVNYRYGRIEKNFHGGSEYDGSKFYDRQQGHVLLVDDHLNQSEYGMGIEFPDLNFDDYGQTQTSFSDSDGFIPMGNLSEPLAASLFVPRNDKLVKIDGNLIIHSIMASEKATVSHTVSGKKNSEETSLAIAGTLAPMVAFSKGKHHQLHRNLNERQRALAYGSADSSTDREKSNPADGKLQQWFHEGLAGPMLSSGMCTEVFRFDISPASGPGGMVPSPPLANSTADERENATNPSKGRKRDNLNRRILHGLPPPPKNESTLNITEGSAGGNSREEAETFQGNSSLSSMVVSVLVDPNEDGVIGKKSLSRIFVVVLLDSVKYVTYSCVLPLKASGPHLVTT